MKRKKKKLITVAPPLAPELTALTMLPPEPDACQKCACKHRADFPHNQKSLYWQYWFRQQHNRWPTWMDAMAHCTEEMRRVWIHELTKRGEEVFPAANGKTK